MKESELTKIVLHRFFNYDTSGKLIWKISRSSHISIGQIAGSVHKSTGRHRVVIGNDHHYSYRLIFAWHFGYYPKTVDHIDRDFTNDRVENLRDVTCSENMMNRSLQKNNKSGIAGVYWDKSVNKWHSQIKINNKNHNLGLFEHLKDAVEVRAMAEKDMFGKYSANHK